MASEICRLIKKHEAGTSTNAWPEIVLKHGEKVVLGRGPDTGIKEKRCSRKQLEFTADGNGREVTIRQLGPNCGSVDGVTLVKGQTVRAKSGSEVGFLAKELLYEIIFGEEPEDRKPSGPNPKKRTLDDHFAPAASKKFASSGDVGKEGTRHDISDSEDEDELDSERKLEVMRRQRMSDRHGAPSHSSSAEKDPASKSSHHDWQMHKDFMVFNADSVTPSAKIAAFDLDWTIIATKSGHVFPVNSHDWRFLFPEVPIRLRNLHADGYKIVFFSNQSGIQRGRHLPRDFCQKVEHIVSELGIPVQAFVSTARGMCRKPRPGMWQHLGEHANGDAVIDYSESFFVGDAAGRPLNWAPRKKKDFSVSDRLFAMNVGVQFHTPEEFFLKQSQAPYVLPSFDPKSLSAQQCLFDPPHVKIPSNSQEVIVLVGLPAAGKSHFVTHHLLPLGYHAVSRDTLVTWQRCVSRCKQLLAGKKSVVVDNTNLDVDTRRRYLESALQAGVPCRCFVFNVPIAHAKHNNKFRTLVGTDDAHKDVNDITLNVLKGKFQEPSLAEGFSEIASVNFVPIFADPERERLYRMYLMEK